MLTKYKQIQPQIKTQVKHYSVMEALKGKRLDLYSITDGYTKQDCIAFTIEDLHRRYSELVDENVTPDDVKFDLHDVVSALYDELEQRKFKGTYTIELQYESYTRDNHLVFSYYVDNDDKGKVFWFLNYLDLKEV